MAQHATISIPVLRHATSSKPMPSADLAGIAESAASNVKSRLTQLAIDNGSLESAIRTVANAATRAEQAVPHDAPFQLASFEVSLGVTASGSVGVMGTGIDLECEATFTLSFERRPD